MLHVCIFYVNWTLSPEGQECICVSSRGLYKAPLPHCKEARNLGKDVCVCVLGIMTELNFKPRSALATAGGLGGSKVKCTSHHYSRERWAGQGQGGKMKVCDQGLLASWDWSRWAGFHEKVRTVIWGVLCQIFAGKGLQVCAGSRREAEFTSLFCREP